MKCAPCVAYSQVNDDEYVREEALLATPDAVTQIGGTMVCANHARETLMSRQGSRDSVMWAASQMARAEGVVVSRANMRRPR